MRWSASLNSFSIRVRLTPPSQNPCYQRTSLLHQSSQCSFAASTRPAHSLPGAYSLDYEQTELATADKLSRTPCPTGCWQSERLAAILSSLE